MVGNPGLTRLESNKASGYNRTSEKVTTKANYGIDRPDIVLFLALVGLLSLFLGGFSLLPPYHGISFGLVFLLFAAWFIVGSKLVKVREAKRTIDSIPWRGDETVLDVGCGRGLWLIAAAKHLTTGKAIGIDTWNRRLQSGNSPEKTLENARIEGVAEKVAVRDGDARSLPFYDSSFDVAVASLVLHHVPPAERRKALSEIVRVLKSGGQLIVLELFTIPEYVRVFQELGMVDVRVLTSRPLFFFGNHIIRANKPLS
jgi:SAM-dependent methyltransferase